jgi:hypothetical protein
VVGFSYSYIAQAAEQVKLFFRTHVSKCVAVTRKQDVVVKAASVRFLRFIALGGIAQFEIFDTMMRSEK